MEDSFDHHHIDVTSPMMETALEAQSPSVCLNSTTKSRSTSSSMRSLQSKSSSGEEIDCIPESSALMTTESSTPPRPKNLPSRLLGASGGHVDDLRDGATRHNSLGVGTCVSVTVEETKEERLRAPIVGYEIMEQRAKFTVFKIHVRRSDRDNWLIFRRYTDFVRVNDKLREIFPIFRLSLPPKRWFGSNFDQNFLEDRQLGLQAFIDNIIGHKEIVLSGPAREFLCLDDPPGPHDNLEESRALCESLDETVYNLRKELAERDKRISLLSAELEEAHQNIALISQHLLNESIKDTNRDASLTPVSGEGSTIEGDIHSQSEADQSMSLAQSEDHSNRPMSRHTASSPHSASSPRHASLPPITEGRSQATVRVTTRSDLHAESRQDADEEPLSSRSDVITVT